MSDRTAQTSSFHRFGDFPTEIRLAVWRECLPWRVVELDYQPDDIIWDDGPAPCAGNLRIQMANKAPPMVARVCRESRAVAFESGGVVPMPEPGQGDHDFAMFMVRQPWLDRARDVLHINWDHMADIEWMSYDWGDPVRCVLSHAARCTPVNHQHPPGVPPSPSPSPSASPARVSITLRLLQDLQRQDGADKPPYEHRRWTRAEMADLMRMRPSWMVVILPPIIVHADIRAICRDEGAADIRPRGAGRPLFGLLGDAPVQLVDADDEARISDFISLGQMPTVTISRRLAGTRDPAVAAAKEELRSAVDAVFGSHAAAPGMQPTIMFRLCTSAPV